jgi:hypothetical protein
VAAWAPSPGAIGGAGGLPGRVVGVAGETGESVADQTAKQGIDLGGDKDTADPFVRAWEGGLIASWHE